MNMLIGNIDIPFSLWSILCYYILLNGGEEGLRYKLSSEVIWLGRGIATGSLGMVIMTLFFIIITIQKIYKTPDLRK